MNLQAPELLIILAVVLLLFGGAKLPKLARSLGQAQKEFKQGIDDGKTPAADATPPAPASETPPAAPEPPAPGADPDAPSPDEPQTGPNDPV